MRKHIDEIMPVFEETYVKARPLIWGLPALILLAFAGLWNNINSNEWIVNH